MASALLFLLLLGVDRTPTAQAQVSGVVVDGVSLAPIANAQVKLQATTISTLTAADGSFSLPVFSGSDLWVVAAKEFYYEEPVRVTPPVGGLEIRLEAVPQGTNPNYTFISPGACGVCHPDQYAQWNGSPMALAGKNTWVYDLFNGTGTPGGSNGFVYTRDSVHRTHSPNSECASCHQPESWVKQPFRALEPLSNLSQNAQRGVSCEACHKIAHADESKLNFPGIYPGAVTFTLPDNGGPNQVSYGVYGDVDFEEPYIMRASWQPQLSAEVCAVCHQDKNDPDEDEEFEEENGVVSEPTYFEWLDSPYGNPESPQYATCVDCHMPPFGANFIVEGVMDPDPPTRDPDTIRHHGMEATGTMVEQAAELDLAVETTPAGLEARVIVTNSGAGHRLPTGVTIRNMVLYVRAWRTDDNLPLVSTGTQLIDDLAGVGSPTQGYYAGLPGKLWAKVTHDANGAHPVPFTEATGVLFDNRIEPLASDTTFYSFALPPGGGNYAVQARLLYRRAFRPLIDTKGWTKTGHGAPLADLEPPYFGHLMAKATWPDENVSIDPAAPETSGPRILSLRPNPVTLGTHIEYRLDAPGNVTLRVLDVQGRAIAALPQGWRSAGTQAAAWDGLDWRRSRVAPGVYWCRLELESGRAVSRRLIVVR